MEQKVPQDVSPTRLPLRTIETTGHHTLVMIFHNTVMQQGTCDYFIGAWHRRSRETRFFPQFLTSHHDMFARCTAPLRPFHTLWPPQCLPEYHCKGLLGDSGASMRVCAAKCGPAPAPPLSHHPPKIDSDTVLRPMHPFHRAVPSPPQICMYSKRI